MKTKLILLIASFLFLISGCCKHKADVPCIPAQYSVTPFIERYSDFWCTGNNEYIYILRSEAQIDSLSQCGFSPPVPFPVDETGFVYIMVGKMAYHYRDTFQTALLKDTCSKKLIYQVDMIQRDTAFNTFPGVISMFCEAENIPSDYQIEVKYQYVPLP